MLQLAVLSNVQRKKFPCIDFPVEHAMDYQSHLRRPSLSADDLNRTQEVLGSGNQ